MKKETLILIGAAGAALFIVMKAKTAKSAVSKIVNGATEILNAAGQKFSNGYRYFSDGTVIDPSGSYWKGGQMIWSPPAVKASMSTSETGLGNWSNEA